MKRNIHNVSERLGGRLINRSEYATGMHSFRTSEYKLTTPPGGTKGAMTLSIPMEEFRPEDLTIQIVNRLLMIKAERVSREEKTENPLIVSEKIYSEYERVWELAEEVDLNKVLAQWREEGIDIRLYPISEESTPAPVCRTVPLKLANASTPLI